MRRTATGGTIRQLVRRVGLDRNPLRRRSDKLETYATLLLIVVFTLTAPAAAWRTWQDAYRDGVRAEHAERAATSRATAVLLAHAPAPPPGDARPVLVRVQARWTAPDGTPVTGRVSVSNSAPRGTRIPVWVDRTGRLVDPPQQRQKTIVNAAMLAGFVVFTLAAALTVVFALLHHVLQRRRLAAWHTAWLHVEPLWTRRRSGGQTT